MNCGIAGRFLVSIGGCLLAVVGAICPRGSLAADYTIVARFGEQPPGAADDRRFAGLWTPMLTSTGKVAFWSDTWDFHGSLSPTKWTPVTDGAWFGDADALDMIAESGQPLPGQPANEPIHDENDWHWFFSAAGDYLAMMSRVTGPGVTQSNERVYMRFGPDGAKLLYRDGMALGDETLVTAGMPSLLPDARFLFHAELQSPGQSSIKREIWGGTPGNLQMLVDDAGLGDINASGQFLYGHYPPIQNSPLESLRMSAIDDPATSVLVAETGMAMPGLPNVTMRLDLGNYAAQLSNSGDVLLRTYTEGLSLPLGHELALVAGKPGDLWTVHYAGMPAPEAGAGWSFDSASYWGAVLTDSGAVAVAARMTAPTGGTPVGLWFMEQEQRQLMAVEGGAAPGLGQDATFAFLPSADGVVANGLGQVIFTAIVAGSQFSQGQDSSIWLRDSDGSLRMLLREGDMLPTPQGDLLFESGVPIGFNDAGQLLLLVNRPLDQALVLMTVPVPEPSTLFLAAAAFLVAVPVVRSRRM